MYIRHHHERLILYVHPFRYERVFLIDFVCTCLYILTYIIILISCIIDGNAV